MKIAFMLLHDFQFVKWSLDDFLKRSHFSKEYSRRLAERGHEVTLYMFHEDVSSLEVLERDGFRIKVFPIQFHFPPTQSYDCAHNLGVTKELSHDKPDLMHFNNYYFWSFPYVVRWAKRNGVKVICQYHGACGMLRPLRKAFIPIYQSVDRYLIARDSEIAYLENNFKVPRSKILKVPNVGVDTDFFKPSELKSESPSLLYVGRMNLRRRSLFDKSPWLLLEIMARLIEALPDAELKLVGDGPGINFLKETSKERGLSKYVTFSGYVGDDFLPPAYSRSWATFIPTLLDSIDPFWEGSLKESLACSTPVVGFNEGVKDYSSSCQRLGYLIPPNAEVGSDILREILSDKARLDDLGRLGREEIRSCCSWNTVIEGLERVYRSLL